MGVKRARTRAKKDEPMQSLMMASSFEQWAMGGRTRSGSVVTTDSAMRVIAVLSCWRVLANAMSLMPLMFYKRVGTNGKTRATDHTLYPLLRTRPNNWQHTVGWVKQGMMHLSGRGNAYWLKLSNPLGIVEQLIPLHPDRMKIEMLDDFTLRYVYADEQGRPIRYLQDEILHIRWLSCDGVIGLNPIQQAREAIGLAQATEQHGSSLFTNGARPGFALSSDQPIKTEAAEKIAEGWNRMYQGAENANKTAILPYGLKPVPLGMTAEDSQFLDTRKYQRSEIAALYGIPPHLIGDLDRATFSNIEQQSLDFVQQTMLPWCREWEASLNRSLLTEDEQDTYFVEFNVEGLLRADSTARAAFYTSLWNLGVLSANEIREKENMNPLEEEGADAHFVQLNMQTLENAAKSTAEPPASAPPADPSSDPSSDPATDPEESPPSEEGMSALDAARQVLRGETGKLLRWEADAMVRLAAKPAEFLKEVEAFYAEHFDRSVGRLRTISYLLNKLGDKHDLRKKIRSLLDDRKAEIIEASGHATPEHLKGVIESVVSGWTFFLNDEGAR